MMTILSTIASTGLILAAPSKSVQAYLDPGSGSFILQLLLAALVGGLFVIRSYWKKIADFLRKIFSRRDDQN
jgi:hypothetical protein